MASLYVWQRNIVTEAGDVIPLAEIEIFYAGATDKPQLYSDEAGSPLLNPFNTDSDGFARFYVGYGRYDIAVNGVVLWEDQLIGVPFFDNVAGLAAARLHSGDVVETKGCDTPGDGGHGVFDIVSSVPFASDGFSIIGTGPYAVLRKPYDVRQFGAAVNGVTVDSAAWQLAVDATHREGGGVLYFPEGVSLASFTIKSFVTIQGAGKIISEIKLPDGANMHVIEAGDFDINADGVVKTEPIGCRTAALRDVTINGNKSNQTEAKHGLAHYGIDLYLNNVEIKYCKGKGIYNECPGGTFSIVAGQNLQNSWDHVEVHHCDGGNIYYNGQSDSTLTDIVCYETASNGANLEIGSKASGLRIMGGHCWGVSEYGVVNNAILPEFVDFHVESASSAKVWAKEQITWHGGHLYEAGSNTSAKGFKLDKDYNNIRSVRMTNIRGGLIDLSAGGVAGANSIVEIFCYSGAAGSALYTGSLPSSSDFDLRMFGLTTASVRQSSQRITAPGGIDMKSGGVDRANYFAGQGWEPVSVLSGSLTVATSFVVLNSGSPVDVTDIASAAGQQGILQVTFRNSGSSAVTFKNNSAKLRNIGVTDKSLNQNESITYVFITGTVWQQVAGK